MAPDFSWEAQKCRKQCINTLYVQSVERGEKSQPQIDPHICDHKFMKKMPSYFDKDRKVFSTNGVRTTEYPCGKNMNFEPYLTPCKNFTWN